MNYKSLTLIAAIGTGLYITSCQDVELGEPNVANSNTSGAAFFSMINASPDAPSLDLYIDNVKQGASVPTTDGQDGYAKATIAANGTNGTNNTFSNVSIRAKASSGTIGGVLNKSDLIYRSTNNGTNNFSASDSGYYTVIVLDTITRPRPARTLNAASIGDTTFFYPSQGSQISVVDRKKLSAAEKAKLAPIGTVPLGSSDPGGLRFLIITDQLPLPSPQRFPKVSAAQAAIRFIQASPNTEDNVTVKVNGATLNAGLRTYPLKFSQFTPAGTPSVGSRTITSTGFTSFAAGDLTVKVTGTAGAVLAEQTFTFAGGGIYTVVMSGNRNDLTKGTVTSLPLYIIKNK